MWKCKKCGRKGLFLSFSPRGLCKECEATQRRADEAAKVAILYENYKRMQDQCEKMTAKLANEQKKLAAAQKKTGTLLAWVESVKYAMESFPAYGQTLPNRTTGGVFIYNTMKGGHFHPASLRTGFFHATKRRFANGR